MVNKMQAQQPLVTERDQILKNWVSALKSGKYAQTKNYLGRNVDGKDCFCSLGLLCEIMKVPKKCVAEGFYAYADTVLQSSLTALPIQVKQSLGLVGSGQFFPAQAWQGNMYYDIAGLNDAGMPFEKIAEVVQNRFIDNPTGWN
jgi:hypothetical protein